MFHRHKWDTLFYKLVKVFEFPTDKFPIQHDTHISQVCRDCGEPRVKVVHGYWNAAGKLGEKN